MTPTTATGVCLLVENRLGFDPHKIARAKGIPVWKVTGAEAGKLNKQIEKNPQLFTWENLELTIEWLYRRRQEVASPAAVCWFVQDALDDRLKPAAEDVSGDQVQDAIDVEMSRQLPGYEEWVGRLTRVVGTGRKEVHAAWLKERGLLFAASLE
jgi:hypothetical protein